MFCQLHFERFHCLRVIVATRGVWYMIWKVMLYIVYKLGDECWLKTVGCQPASSMFTSQIVFLSKLLKWNTIYIRRLYSIYYSYYLSKLRRIAVVSYGDRLNSVSRRFFISIIDENISTTLRNGMHSVMLFVATVLIRLIRYAYSQYLSYTGRGQRSTRGRRLRIDENTIFPFSSSSFLVELVSYHHVHIEMLGVMCMKFFPLFYATLLTISAAF